MNSNFQNQVKVLSQKRAKQAISYFGMGMTVADIALVLGVSQPTVRKYLLREKDNFLWIRHYYFRGLNSHQIAKKQKLPDTLVEEVIRNFKISVVDLFQEDPLE